ncbi:MAG TPA: ABC-2 transporter permease [Candidatus Anaerobutyricum stercoris]|uniref:ABC-2 transporter permease n=1 Tax=Candidatus Anaerobutyricum stercoris TaxID=2838457 RepID=A0A9D2EMU3_9FIRM|nr:ABC-2 transporter permease [Eubacterium sp. An3]OUO26099.1 hypothetical protein B5F87_15405 [Eubacterium sp. An3]HIZ40031.1 ABC-2 transporter permease [Candidatus Anaerobutyricum stercoris]
MKGLLIKDFKLMKMQKRFFLLILLVGVVITFSSYDVAFTTGFMASVSSLFSISSISYDEFDNGNAFLFSLPISRRTYAVEKYIFGAILGCCAWVLAMIIAISVGFLKGIHPDTETWFSAFLILSMMFVILALMLPFQLKFGGERGRIVLLLVIGGLAPNGLELIGIDLLAMLDAMPAVNAGIMSFITLLIALLFLGVSCLISIGIVQKKEF